MRAGAGYVQKWLPPFVCVCREWGLLSPCCPAGLAVLPLHVPFDDALTTSSLIPNENQQQGPSPQRVDDVDAALAGMRRGRSAAVLRAHESVGELDERALRQAAKMNRGEMVLPSTTCETDGLESIGNGLEGGRPSSAEQAATKHQLEQPPGVATSVEARRLAVQTELESDLQFIAAAQRAHDTPAVHGASAAWLLTQHMGVPQAGGAPAVLAPWGAVGHRQPRRPSAGALIDGVEAAGTADPTTDGWQ
jgi:hypothetical protein